MVTVINVDKNGNVIPDLSKVVINLNEFPGLYEEMVRIIEKKVASEGQVTA